MGGVKVVQKCNNYDIPACPITAANNHSFYAVSMGDLEIDVPNGALLTKVLLCNALYAPDLGLTVVSISCIVKAGCTVEFEDGMCKIKRDGCKAVDIRNGQPLSKQGSPFPRT